VLKTVDRLKEQTFCEIMLKYQKLLKTT